MPNHIHLILLPEYSPGMAHALGRTHADFARHYHLERRACGHVWQARYFSAPLDRAHLWRAMAYVERNPVRAHLVEHAEQYAWFSTRLRRPGGEKGCRIDLSGWRSEYDWQSWKEALETSIDGFSHRAPSLPPHRLPFVSLLHKAGPLSRTSLSAFR